MSVTRRCSLCTATLCRPHTIRSFPFQVCQILEKAVLPLPLAIPPLFLLNFAIAQGLWRSSIPFDDAVQPMFYNPRVLSQLTQELLDAALLGAVNAMDLSASGHIIKRGCERLSFITQFLFYYFLRVPLLGRLHALLLIRFTGCWRRKADGSSSTTPGACQKYNQLSLLFHDDAGT